MRAPIVLVCSDTADVNGLRASAAPAPYLDALALAGLVPAQVPTIAEPFPIAPLIDAAAGVVATGARSNVHPARYRHAESDTARPFDLDRDQASFALIEAALARDLPLLCICRGMQELNVARGGTLTPAVHEEPGRMDHRGADTKDMDERFAIKHAVELAPDGRLAAILGAGSVRVNSVHRQAIDALGAGLTVEARAPDGTVEAVSVDGARFAIGVQWHPEYFARTDPPSRAIFEAFADAVRDAARVTRHAA